MIIVFLNPVACDGRAKRAWPALAAEFAAMGIECELVCPESDGAQGGLVAAALADGHRVETIVGVGGDGTHNSLVNAIVRFQRANPAAAVPPYALVPLGTGNNIAKSFGLEPARRLKLGGRELRAAAAAVKGQDRRVDLGIVGGRYFMDGFSIGADAAMLGCRNRLRTWLRPSRTLTRLLGGYPAYVVASLALARHRAPRGTVKVDGEKWYEGPIFGLLLNNVRIYGGEFDPTPAAVVDDGMLDAVVTTGMLQHVGMFVSSRRGFRISPPDGSRPPPSLRTRGAKFEIELDSPVPAQVDGEVVEPAANFLVETLPRAFTLRTPR